MATRNIVPQSDQSSHVGTPSKRWNELIANDVYCSSLLADYLEIPSGTVKIVDGVHGEVLAWDNATTTWKGATHPGGVTATNLNGLDDVNYTSPVDKATLMWNGAEWTDRSPDAIGAFNKWQTSSGTNISPGSYMLVQWSSVSPSQHRDSLAYIRCGTAHAGFDVGDYIPAYWFDGYYNKADFSGTRYPAPSTPGVLWGASSSGPALSINGTPVTNYSAFYGFPVILGSSIY